MRLRPIVTPLCLGLVFLVSCVQSLGDRAAVPDACGPGDGAVGPSPACPDECDRCEDGVCHVVCAAGSACASDTITCAPGMDCEVSCFGHDACKSATIVGPSGFDLELSCSGADACGGATLRCGSGGCDWSCVDSGSCDDLEVE